MVEISVVQGDITRLHTDAIVNAANHSLLGGGGVDGAIHRAAGPGLLEACARLHGCETAQAKITGGYKLPAKHVIHTVGPVWRGGSEDEPLLLENCYRNSLQLAVKYDLQSIASPAISTGVYGFPFEKASGIALHTVRKFLKEPGSLKQVIFVLFSRNEFEIFQKLYNHS